GTPVSKLPWPVPSKLIVTSTWVSKVLRVTLALRCVMNISTDSDRRANMAWPNCAARTKHCPTRALIGCGNCRLARITKRALAHVRRGRLLYDATALVISRKQLCLSFVKNLWLRNVLPVILPKCYASKQNF